MFNNQILKLMDVNVNVTVELGAKTLALLVGTATMAQTAMAQDKQPVQAAVQQPSPAVEAKAPAAEVVDAKPAEQEKTRTRRTKEQIEADNKATESSFADMKDEDKLDAIKAKVTELTKNKKGSDVKWMLGQFNAASVSKAEPLEPEDYDAFFDAISRYAKGEALTDIFPEDDLG